MLVWTSSASAICSGTNASNNERASGTATSVWCSPSRLRPAPIVSMATVRASSSGSGDSPAGSAKRSRDTCARSNRTGSAGGDSTVEGSSGSAPVLTVNAAASIATVRARKPGESNDGASATPPAREMRPKVVFSPSTPQNAAGSRIDPPVSLPMASGTSPAATAAADPPEDPPGTRPRSHGFEVEPRVACWVVIPQPNS